MRLDDLINVIFFSLYAQSIMLLQCRILTEASRIVDVLEDVFEHIFSNMHNVQKNLQYWQDKAEVVT